MLWRIRLEISLHVTVIGVGNILEHKIPSSKSRDTHFRKCEEKNDMKFSYTCSCVSLKPPFPGAR